MWSSMLTYQLQKRYFRIMEKGKAFSFPNTVELEIFLEPTEMFGVGDKLTKTNLFGYDAEILIDPDTGKSGIVPNHLFEPIEAIVELTNQNMRLEMHGNKLYAKCECKDLDHLNSFVIALHYIFPILLSIEFLEPNIVKHTEGRVGGVPFRWELDTLKSEIDTTTKERQEQLIIDSFERLSFICNQDNRRLAAAFYYFYVAKRLKEAGNSPYEFMSEIILNYCKVLEILFVHSDSSMNDVRTELKKFGYDLKEINVKFIPIMILRNYFDVGHVSIEMFNQNQLSILYKYLDFTEIDFRDLLKTVMNKVKAGSYQLKRDLDLKPNKEKQKKMEKLIESFKERNIQGLKCCGIKQNGNLHSFAGITKKV